MSHQVIRDDEIDARYMLTATLVLAILLFCLQILLSVTSGVQSDCPLSYICAMGSIVVANIIALLVARYSLSITAYGFCTFVVGAITYMVVVSGDACVSPILLVMLPVCSYSLSYFVTTKQMLPFLWLVIAILLAFGIRLAAVDTVIPSIAASVVGSFLVSRLRTQLQKLRGAIRILAEHGRKDEELTQHLRRIAGNNAQ